MSTSRKSQPILLVQARLAARSDVSLDIVLRRYFAGYSLLGDFLVGEADRLGWPTPLWQETKEAA
jgi:hypothetical protein